MTTSLAAQLLKLATPQTSLLYDSNKRPSILFDAKNAANKDREVIYDIGISGLEELIEMNAAFRQFENTLFNKAAMDMERSVEKSEVNIRLNENIRKFFYHLSPYFMLQPAHKCLEWLIRRFHIQNFNRKDFILLILPYHETRIFVRCIQIVDIRDVNDEFSWLKGVQKSGIPLSKQTIVNHAANNPSFLKSVGQFTAAAAKEMDLKANNLQAIFAFYCTTTIGALEYTPTVSENHIVAILKTLGKGLSSPAIDFVASSLMIFAQLVTKANLSTKIIEYVLQKICILVHPSLTMDAIMLIILIFQTQHEQYSTLSDELLEKIVASKWIPGALGQLNAQGINILPFYKSVLTKCLKKVQEKDAKFANCRTFCETLMLEITFSDSDAELIIQCVLDTYFYKETKQTQESSNDIISLDSEDESDYQGMDEIVTEWYSNYLKRFEAQYPKPFDRIVKEIMKGHTDFSQSKRNALRNVLGFLLQVSYTDKDKGIFENLYHFEASRRSDAVKYLVEHIDSMNLKSESNEFVKDSMSERLNDDSPEVVAEILKLDASTLIEIMGHEMLIQKLFKILSKCLKKPEKWSKITIQTIQVLTARKVWRNADENKILIILFPFLYPNSEEDVDIVKTLLSSDFAKHNKFFTLCKAISSLQNKSPKVIQKSINDLVSSKNGLPACESLIKTFEGFSVDENVHSRHIYFNIIVLVNSLPRKSSPELSRKVIDLTSKMLQQIVAYSGSVADELERNKLPMNTCFIPVEGVIDVTDFGSSVEDNNFAQQSDSLSLKLRLFEIIVTGYFTSTKANAKKGYSEALKKFLHTLYPETTEMIEFLCNFFIGQLIEKDECNPNFVSISPEFQIRVMRLMNVILVQKDDYKIEIQAFTKILIALYSDKSVIRECALQTFETLKKKSNVLDENYKLLLKKVVKNREELSLDNEQLPLVVFTALSDKNKLKVVLDDLVGLVDDPETPLYLAASILDILKHLNNSKLFLTMMNCGLRILKSSEKEIMFSNFQSIILKLAISKVDVTTIKNLINSVESWEFVTKALKSHILLNNDDNQYVTPSILLMGMIEDDVYQNLPAKYRPEFVQLVIEAATTSLNSGTILAAGKLFQNTEFDSKILLSQFEKMRAAALETETPLKNKRKSRQNVAPSAQVLSTNEWKCGVTLLELLQNKKKLLNVQLLVPKLFEILKRCLEFEEQSPVEYAKQMILSLILQCCLKISPDGTAKRGVLSDNVFKIDLIVQCIRGTQNPQTHHHALLLLSHMAFMVPEQVLHNMMDIFTFVGSSIVRHDDAYSFQIISKIIDSIVPTLIKSNTTSISAKDQQQVIPILKVFSDIILDVPEHRRIPLYTKLIQTLNPTDFLWVFLGVLFESEVVKDITTTKIRQNKLKQEAEHADEFSKRIQIALAISKEFEPNVVIETCTKLIRYLQELPADINTEPNASKMDIDITDSCIFSVDGHTSKHLRHFKYVIVQFVNALISSTQIINKIAVLTDEETLLMKKYYQNIIIQILTYIPEISKAIDKNADNRAKYWKIMLHYCFDLLENTISLLSPDTLIVVVEGLMNHKFTAVRRKVIELLNNKLQYQKAYFDETNSANMMKLLEPLMMNIETSLEESMSVNANEKTALVQLALLSLKLLSKTLSDSNPEAFKKILLELVSLLGENKEMPNGNVLASLILCIAELCANLKAHSIQTLSKFLPTIISITVKRHQTGQSFDLLTASVVTSILKIVETLPLFLSPYLVKMIVELSKIYAALMKHKKQDTKMLQIVTKIQLIWQKMSVAVPIRVLIPAVDSSYQQLISENELKAIEPVMSLMSESFTNIKSSEFVGIQTELSNFFLSALQFRCDNSGNKIVKQKNIDKAEEHVIKAFVSLILKLSESSFRPLYFKVYDWANRDTASNDRAITFFSLSSQIAEALKSLFVLFASDLIQNAATILDKANIVKVEDEESLFYADSVEKNLTLINYILKTLYTIFLHDNQNFMNALRFDVLMQPLVDQIENTIIFGNAQLKSTLVSCLSQMAVAVGDDALWKQLNYQVLLKTRSNNPEIRLFALDACVDIVKKIGDDFSPLLPETIPFMAELLEDENHDVERGVQRAVQELEKVTGESLQKYF